MKKMLTLALLALLPIIARADSTSAIAAGSPVTLTVTSDGTAPFTYQWYKDSMAIAGATGATYVIPAFAAANAGLYQCRVGNPAGNAMSDNATLTPAASSPANVKITVTSKP